MKKEITKNLITQALKESRQGEMILSLQEIAEILQEALGDDIPFLIEQLKGRKVYKERNKK